jgi:hypothetical protein
MPRGRYDAQHSWSAESIENMIADLRLIRSNSAARCDRQSLRQITAAMREIANGRWLQAWKTIGLQKQPFVHALKLQDRGVTNASVAIAAGGLDSPENLTGMPGLSMDGLVCVETEGEKTRPPVRSLDWSVSNPTNHDVMDSTNDAFVDFNFPLTDFLKAPLSSTKDLKFVDPT